MKTVLKALLAATALFPVGAQAQQAEWRQRGEARAERGQDGERGDWRARRGGEVRTDVGLDAQAQVRLPQAAEAYRGDRQRYQGRVDAQASGQAGVQAPAYQSRDAYRASNDRDYRRRDDRVRDDDNRGDAVRRYDYNRQPMVRGYAQGYGPRYDDRRYDDRRFDDRRSRGWDRDWRRDRRYDWNRYRGYNRSAYRLPRYYAPAGWVYGYRRFSIGMSLSSFLWDQNYWIDDPFAYRLPPAYGPYRWVRYYDDALLIDIRTGVVVDSVYGIFY